MLEGSGVEMMGCSFMFGVPVFHAHVLKRACPQGAVCACARPRLGFGGEFRMSGFLGFGDEADTW